MTASKRASTFRSIFATAAAVALAACSSSSVGPTPQPPACKGLDQACGAGAECCSGGCPSGACGCSAVAERCGTSGDCCTSLGPTRCDAGACVSGQRALGDVCDWDGLCASLNCDLTGHCAAACLGWNASCSSSAQCCSYFGCGAGTCTPDCGSTNHACTGDNECCSDYRCRAGVCQAGLCGTANQKCGSSADCCTAAQGGKNYFCDPYGSCDLGWPGRTPPDACTTDADCAGDNPCRGGYCHWPDGHQPDGGWCLDGQECDSGICTSTAAGVPGGCCSGAGAGCVAGGYGTICCSGLDLACTGTPGAQSCGSCLDFGNSGPQGETQCTRSDQCCMGRNLSCVQGECCTQRGYACTAGTGGTECCSGDTCGDVTTYQGTTANICCGTYGARCGYASACCDGFLCGNDGTCHLAPGEACTDSAQCADYSGCKIETPPAGVCCSHDMGTCATNADCCSGICDPTYHSCDPAPAYGACLDDSDCIGPDYNQQWNGQVCGGNATLPPFTCCPVPGDTCSSASDCCETGDSCKLPYDGSSASALCCRETPATCSQDNECCTGMCWSHYVGGSPVGTCCAYPYITAFTCASDADCCDSATYSGVYGTTQCGDGSGAMRCCFKSGQNPSGAAASCCSGRLDQSGCAADDGPKSNVAVTQSCLERTHESASPTRIGLGAIIPPCPARS